MKRSLKKIAGFLGGGYIVESVTRVPKKKHRERVFIKVRGTELLARVAHTLGQVVKNWACVLLP